MTMNQFKADSRTVKIGDGTFIGGGHPILVQTMCNTHTSDVDATLSQCKALARAGAEMIRITVPSLNDVASIAGIRELFREAGFTQPIVADVHFSSEIALAVAKVVDKVRINPGNFHKDHGMARSRFRELLAVCKEHGTAIRIGLNHGSLGEYITNLYGNTPYAMAKAAMEWVEMCREEDFHQVVVSLKSSNTITMVSAYRELAAMMAGSGEVFPFHVGVTEAGNGDSGRIKSLVGISSLLEEGIGDTVRVSLTEDPVNEIAVARYLSDRYSGDTVSTLESVRIDGKTAYARYGTSDRMRLLMDASCDFGRKLLDKEIDDVVFEGPACSDGYGEYLRDELLQAARRRFYKPEYIACPGCGRTMYDLQAAFEEVKAKTAGLKDVVIAVMGCIVNGPGEMADADWGYVGEGNHKVSIYRKSVPVLRHVPDTEAVDRLLELIRAER